MVDQSKCEYFIRKIISKHFVQNNKYVQNLTRVFISSKIQDLLTYLVNVKIDSVNRKFHKSKSAASMERGK